MAGIISSGIGSGLDIAGIVQQLVVAEGQPAESRIVLQESRAQAKLSAFGSLKSALSAMRTSWRICVAPTSFWRAQQRLQTRTCSLPRRQVAHPPQATLSKSCSWPRHKNSHRVRSQEPDAVVGTGSLTIASSGNAMVLDINAENNTLAGIRDAINAAPDNPGRFSINRQCGQWQLSDRLSRRNGPCRCDHDYTKWW